MRVSAISRERVGVDTPTGRTTVRRVRPYRAQVVVRPETFADRVRWLRTQRGLSLRGLAILAGVPHATIGGCERYRQDVEAHTVARLARAFGVSMDYLWLGEEAS